MTNRIPLFLLVTALLMASSLQAQPNPVPHSSFEEWTSVPPWGNFPDGWIPAHITPGTDSHSGVYAADGLSTVSGPASLRAGVVNYSNLMQQEGFAISYRPNALEGWYKFTGYQSDEMAFLVTIWSQGQKIGSGYVADSTPRDSYTFVSLPIQYTGTGTPDMAKIEIWITNEKVGPHIGSTYSVDDIALTGTSSGVTTTSAMSSLPRNFPNPVSNRTTITYSLDRPEHVTLDLFSALGEAVTTLFDGPAPAGTNTVRFDATQLPSGLYFYRVTTPDNTSLCRSIQVVH